jgi:hypothetical protein
VAVAQAEVMRPRGIDTALALDCPIMESRDRYTRDFANLLCGKHFPSVIGRPHDALLPTSKRSFPPSSASGCAYAVVVQNFSSAVARFDSRGEQRPRRLRRVHLAADPMRLAAIVWQSRRSSLPSTERWPHAENSTPRQRRRRAARRRLCAFRSPQGCSRQRISRLCLDAGDLGDLLDANESTWAFKSTDSVGGIGKGQAPAGRHQDHRVADMNVTVAEPFQVVHDGIAYGPGETVEVPDEVAGGWIARGWAKKTSSAKPRARR